MAEQQIPPVRGPKKKSRTGLIIFLVLLGIAILIGGILLAQWLIWNKVKDTIEEGTSQLELASECREVELQAQITEVAGSNGGQYELILTNNGNRNVGVKLVLLNTLTSSTSEVLDFGDFIGASETKTSTLDLTEKVIGADKIEMTPYFLNELGEELICPTTVSIDV